MKKRLAIFLVSLAIVGGLLLYSVVFLVTYNQDVVVKTFGATSEVIHGADAAGLHWKLPWPIQRVVTYDARTYILDDAATERQLRDSKQVVITLYCAWRVSDPDMFNRNPETFKKAEADLRGYLQSTAHEVVGQYEMADLVNTSQSAMKIEEMEGRILQQLKAKVEKPYGVEILSVGTKSLGVTQNVAQAIIEAQKAERQKDIKTFTAQGESIASAIRSRADSASKQILEFAQRKASFIVSEGIESAVGQYEKYKDAPELAVFLRGLESMKAGLKNRTVILLDSTELPGMQMMKPGAKLWELPAASQPATSPATK